MQAEPEQPLNSCDVVINPVGVERRQAATRPPHPTSPSLSAWVPASINHKAYIPRLEVVPLLSTTSVFSLYSNLHGQGQQQHFSFSPRQGRVQQISL